MALLECPKDIQALLYQNEHYFQTKHDYLLVFPISVNAIYPVSHVQHLLFMFKPFLILITLHAQSTNLKVTSHHFKTTAFI